MSEDFPYSCGLTAVVMIIPSLGIVLDFCQYG